MVSVRTRYSAMPLNTRNEQPAFAGYFNFLFFLGFGKVIFNSPICERRARARSFQHSLQYDRFEAFDRLWQLQHFPLSSRPMPS